MVAMCAGALRENPTSRSQLRETPRSQSTRVLPQAWRRVPWLTWKYILRLGYKKAQQFLWFQSQLKMQFSTLLLAIASISATALPQTAAAPPPADPAKLSWSDRLAAFTESAEEKARHALEAGKGLFDKTTQISASFILKQADIVQNFTEDQKAKLDGFLHSELGQKLVADSKYYAEKGLKLDVGAGSDSSIAAFVQATLEAGKKLEAEAQAAAAKAKDLLQQQAGQSS